MIKDRDHVRGVKQRISAKGIDWYESRNRKEWVLVGYITNKT